jgi:hypothetical protein
MERKRNPGFLAWPRIPLRAMQATIVPQNKNGGREASVFY